MRKILIFCFLICVSNIGATFQVEAGTKGVLQYCFYKGQWSLIFKYEKKFKNNTQWCRIVKKSENPDFYNELFKKAIQHSGKWWITTATLERIVKKHEAIENKYKEMEKEIEKKVLDNQKKKEKKKKKLAKQKEAPTDEEILKKLNDLVEDYRNGIISEEEFISKKGKLLNN